MIDESLLETIEFALDKMRDATVVITEQNEQIRLLKSENAQLRASLDRALNHLSPQPSKEPHEDTHRPPDL